MRPWCDPPDDDRLKVVMVTYLRERKLGLLLWIAMGGLGLLCWLA